MKKTTKYLIIMLTLILCPGLISGCTKKDFHSENSKSESLDETNEETDTSLSSIEGNWTAVASRYTDTFYVQNEMDYFDINFNIYTEDNIYKLDCESSIEENSTNIYGKALVTSKGAMYDTCPNQDWYVTFFTKENEDQETEYNFTLADKDTIEFEIKYTYHNNEGNEEQYSTYYFLKRTDSDLEAVKNDYRYFQTIEVSNVKDFYNSLGSNRIIILKEGTYNFSELPEIDKDNKNVNWRYDYNLNSDSYEYGYFPAAQAYCYDINYLKIVGEEGKEVHICTEDELVAPLAFSECNYITLDNLTVGHQVTPGLCAGSVTYFNSTNNVIISNCNLYGSGTYGIWTDSSYTYTITNTDIYDCSYGLVYLTDSNEFNFSNCSLRDSSDSCMFSLSGSYNISFENCNITNNHITDGYSEYFIFTEDYSCDTVSFSNCKFSNNTYNNLSNYDVQLLNCSFDDNK